MSTQPKWTPGPWFLKERNEFGEDVIGASDGEHGDPWNVAVVCGMCGWPEDNSRANAHLIAAAPDLYAALEDALDALKTHYASGDAMQGHWESDARAALAKARGQA